LKKRSGDRFSIIPSGVKAMSLQEHPFVNAMRASKFLKALANDNRLVILCSLAEGEKNVGELERILGIRQPTLSQQLGHHPIKLSR